MGLASQSENLRKKALWAYVESLKSNCGYDEIYYNLAATQMSMGALRDDGPDLTLENPRGMTVTEPAKEIGGAIFNFSRALAINPMSQEAYVALGNIYIQDREKYGKESAVETGYCGGARPEFWPPIPGD